MKHSQILPDIIACKEQIEKDFDVELDDNLRSKRIMLRGENMQYSSTKNSINRFLLDSDGKTMKPFYFVAPMLDFYDIYSDYHSDVTGLTRDESEGFLQHYGFPTDYFDVSPSFNTAKFFALYGNVNEQIGTICAMDSHGLDSYYRLVDLTSHPYALRPIRQYAFGAKHEKGITDLKNAELDKYFKIKWYYFNKRPKDQDFVEEHISLIYPSEKELGVLFSKEFMQFFYEHQYYIQMGKENKKILDDLLINIRSNLK